MLAERLDKLTRSKIYRSSFWKEKCFGLDAASILEEATQLQYVGGIYGPSRKPAHFLCLLLKLFQINPQADILQEYLQNPDFKYVTALALFYLRLSLSHQEVFPALDPQFNDNRKIIVREADGRVVLMHIDELVDRLLTEQQWLGISLGKLARRKPRNSILVSQVQGRVSDSPSR